MKGEQAVATLLQPDGGGAAGERTPVGLLVCDMNFDPRLAAELVASAAPLLADRAMLVMTIKLPKQATAKLIDRMVGHCGGAPVAGAAGALRNRSA